MKITYFGGSFFCDAAASSPVLKQNKWKWDGEYWFTTKAENVLPLYGFCSTAAKNKIDKWQQSVLDSISDSFAATTDAVYPSPPGLEYLNYQKAGIEYALSHKGNILIGDPMGLGKAQPLYSKVLTPFGWRRMGDLKVGDTICNPNGGVQWVSGVFEQGMKESWKVLFSDGTSTECCDEHLWTVYVNGWDDSETLTLNQIRKLVGAGDMVAIPTVYPPTFQHRPDLMVEPYLFGVILSGSMEEVSDGLLITTHNKRQVDAVLSACEMIPHATNLYREVENGVFIASDTITKPLIESFRTWRELTLSNKPLDFMLSFYEMLHAETKELIINGYMDFCGEPLDGYKAEYWPNFPCDDAYISRLAQSLGGLVWKSVDGERSFMTLPNSMDMFLAFSDEYHTKNDPDYTFEPQKRIVGFVQNGKTPMRCIRVSGEDKLYITDDYIVTHNTIQAIGYSNATRKSASVLIICPATLKENWKREWEKWCVHGLSVGIAESKTRTKTNTVDGKKTIKRWREDIFPDTSVVVVNYEQLEKFDLKIKTRDWDLVIIDEADRLRNPTSIANKCIFGGTYKRKRDGKTIKTKFNKLTPKKILFLTGTPIPKSPINMWSIIQSCDPNGLGRNWVSFTRKYCDAQKTPFGMDTSGASNLEELQFLMRQRFMVRRKKTEVLADLPPKRREIVLLPSEGLTKHIERELSIARKGMYEFEKMMGLAPQEEEAVSIEDLRDFMETFNSQFLHMSYEERVNLMKNTPLEIAFEEFAEARQQLSIAKIPMIKERINQALEEEECLVFFGIHTDFIEALAKEFDNYAMITGKVPVKKRQAQVDYFQNDKDCRLFFGNINAAGVGITLTRASLTQFGELSWNETEVSQAEDRTWRIGQQNACLSQHLVVAGSLDARFVELNWDKSVIAATALDHENLDPSRIFSTASQF